MENGRIVYQENGGAENFLTPEDINITKFQLDYLTSPISEGVRVEIDVEVNKGEEIVTKEYEGFSVLRQSYE